MDDSQIDLYSRLVPMCDLVSPIAIRAGVTLGLFSLLHQKTLNVIEISNNLGISQQKISILLSVLTDLNLVQIAPDEKFKLSELGEVLSDDNGVFNKSLNLYTAVGQYEFAVTHLVETLQGGGNYFTSRFSKDYWSFVESNTADLEMIASLASETASFNANQLIEEKIWNQVERILDIGGGNGNILVAIAKKYSHIYGTVLDLPGRVKSAQNLINKSNLSARIDVLGDSFFSPLPKGYDCYLLNAILADWSDEQCVALLSNIRESMNGDNLLVISEVDPSESFNDPSIHLKMICAAEGWIRTPDEVEMLSRKSGLQLIHSICYKNRFTQIYKINLGDNFLSPID